MKIKVKRINKSNKYNSKKRFEKLEKMSSFQKRIESVMRQMVEEKIMECATMYGFKGEEAIERLLGLEVKSKKPSRGSVKEIVMPFVKSGVNHLGCGGLEYNHGLFTQCSNVREEEKEYCMKCEKECSEKGSPVSGRLSERLEKGLMEYRDPNGRKPVHYLSYLNSKSQSIEEARLKALEKGLDIEEHLVEMKAEEAKRGRPKKEGSSVERRGRPKKSPTKVEKEAIVDLFASSVEEFLDDEDAESVTESVGSVAAPVPAAVSEVIEVAKSDAVKEANKKSQEAEKVAAKEAKRLEKEAQEAAKEVKKKAKEEKESKKKVSSKKESDVANAAAAPVAKEVVERPKVTVSEFTYQGVVYWKSTDNIMYDPKTKEVKGIWSESEGKMLDAPEESDDELEEEDYEE